MWVLACSCSLLSTVDCSDLLLLAFCQCTINTHKQRHSCNQIKHFAHTTSTLFVKPGCLDTDVTHNPDHLELNLPMSYFLEAPLTAVSTSTRVLALNKPSGEPLYVRPLIYCHNVCTDSTLMTAAKSENHTVHEQEALQAHSSICRHVS